MEREGGREERDEGGREEREGAVVLCQHSYINLIYALSFFFLSVSHTRACTHTHAVTHTLTLTHVSAHTPVVPPVNSWSLLS